MRPCRFSAGVPYPLCTPNSTQGHPMHPRIGRGLQQRSSQTMDHSERRKAPPGFFQPHSKQNTCTIRPLRDPGVTLGRRLGDPRVTLGSPNPNPKPNPSRQRVATPKHKNPASKSRVKSLMWHSRPRLCVLNQINIRISRGAQPPSAVEKDSSLPR